VTAVLSRLYTWQRRISRLYIYVYTYICIYVQMYICIGTHIQTHTHTHTHSYIYIYIYKYKYIYTQRGRTEYVYTLTAIPKSPLLAKSMIMAKLPSSVISDRRYRTMLGCDPNDARASTSRKIFLNSSGLSCGRSTKILSQSLKISEKCMWTYPVDFDFFHHA
jgi:hypothetical protein